MPPDEEEGQDLRSVLSRVVDEAEAEPTATEAPAREPPAREAPEPRSTEPAGERQRGPDGKFLPKEPAEGSEAEPPEAVEPVAVVDPEPEPAKTGELATDVPQHWSQADKDLIASLPKDSQAKVVERYKAIEAGFTPRLQKAAEIERNYAGAIELFQPYAAELQQQGKTPSDIIRTWAAVEQNLVQGRQIAAQGGQNTKGAEIVANIIRSYGVDPGAVAAFLKGEMPPPQNGNGYGDQGSYVPPALFQKLDTMEQRLANREAADRNREAAERAARENSTQSQIEAFANEKDDTGSLKHPYFSELERDMAAFAQMDLSQGRVPSIPDLYDRAVYANRETRTKALAASSAESARKAAAERKAQSERAVRAASSIAGSPGAGGSPAERTGPRSLRDEIAAAAADLEAG
jgi:hypothetical protein